MSTKQIIENMFSAGAHFGLGRSRRHPTVSPYIFGTKNNTDIFDLERTSVSLNKALDFISSLAREDKTILFVGGKKETSILVKNTAQSISMPYVDGRWIGGTLSNFPQIRKRIDLYERLVSERDKGELAKYTKRERMLIDKDIAKLERMFLGISSMKKIPDALFIIDPRYEKIAVKEAQDLNLPIIALAGSDCDISKVQYPIIGNDSAKSSVSFFLDLIAKTYHDSKLAKKA